MDGRTCRQLGARPAEKQRAAYVVTQFEVQPIADDLWDRDLTRSFRVEMPIIVASQEARGLAWPIVASADVTLQQDAGR